MSKGWMRVREAAALLSVSESTVRRRIAEGQLRGRTGKSGRQEVFVPAKLRGQAQAGFEVEVSAHDAVNEPDANLGHTRNRDTALTGTPADSFAAQSSSESETDIIKRYERLAGGSLVLAQKRADELTQAASAAYENLAYARQQLRQVRKVAVAGWVVAGLAVCLAFVLSFAFGIDSARARAAAQAGQHAAEQADQQVRALQAKLAEHRGGAFDGVDVDDAQVSVQSD